MRLAFFFLLALFIGSCSFYPSNNTGTDISLLVRSGKVSRNDFDRAKKYDFACLVIKGIGVVSSQWTQITKDNAVTPTALSVQFKMGNFLGGYSYTITALAVDTNNSNIESTVTQSPCPLNLPVSAGWAQLGKTTVKIPERTNGTFKIDIPFDFYEPISAAKACVGSCYDDLSAQDEGRALGPNEVEMEYVFANGSSGFKVWREKGGEARILNATGFVANGWQKPLIPMGNQFGNYNYTDAINIAGRTCPRNVFLGWDPKEQMIATNRCLYYDGGNNEHMLNEESSSGQPLGAVYLVEWNDSQSGRGEFSSYYEGNIKVCSDKGMRLPTMYETTMEKPVNESSELPTGDRFGIDPEWAGIDKGVPPVGDNHLWTASANILGSTASKYYWVWSSGVPNFQRFPYDNLKGVRCVLPSH